MKIKFVQHSSFDFAEMGKKKTNSMEKWGP